MNKKKTEHTFCPLLRLSIKLEGGKQIVTEMQKLAQITRETTDNMTEIASGAEQITKAVEDVVSITVENKASIMKLAQEVGKFKIN